VPGTRILLSIKHPITTSKNGISVYVDLINSRASKRISEQPRLLNLAKTLLGSKNLSKTALTIEHDFGEPVGNTDIVATSSNDVIVYAKMLRQTNYTRFVKKRELVSSNFVSVRLHRDADGEYELDDLWFGQLAPPLPDEQHATDASDGYWQSHAVVLNGQLLQRNTATSNSPFEQVAQEA
jgi:hypothetical protein